MLHAPKLHGLFLEAMITHYIDLCTTSNCTPPCKWRWWNTKKKSTFPPSLSLRIPTAVSRAAFTLSTIWHRIEQIHFLVQQHRCVVLPLFKVHIYLEKPSRIILGPLKHVLHLVWSAFVKYTANRTALKVALYDFLDGPPAPWIMN